MNRESKMKSKLKGKKMPVLAHCMNWEYGVADYVGDSYLSCRIYNQSFGGTILSVESSFPWEKVQITDQRASRDDRTINTDCPMAHVGIR